MTVKHPAKYTDSLLPIFAELLQNTLNVFDPMAGVGKLALINQIGYQGQVFLNELEPEWGNQAPLWAIVTIGDAACLSYRANTFDAICTSPTYGNRMADHHEAKDGSKRNTYKHTLGRNLHPANTGAMQWGDHYCGMHLSIWAECCRVLKPDGLLILSISDHIRKGQIVPVTDWHIACLQGLGFTLQEHRKVATPRLRYGANGNARVGHESVIVFRKAA